MEVGKKVAQPTPATRIVDRGRCTLLKQCTYIVRDLGQQPTTWMGTGCCSTGGNQQRSQQCAEQVLQPGKEPARRAVGTRTNAYFLVCSPADSACVNSRGISSCELCSHRAAGSGCGYSRQLSKGDAISKKKFPR